MNCIKTKKNHKWQPSVEKSKILQIATDWIKSPMKAFSVFFVTFSKMFNISV